MYQFYRRKNGESGFYYVSSNCKNLFGLTAAEIIENNPDNIYLHPDDLGAYIEAINIACNQRSDFNYSGRFIIRGKAVWWRANSTPVEVSDDEIVFHGVIINETESREYQARLEMLESALGAAENSLLITNEDGIIIYANTAFYKQCGYAESELLGKTPRILKSGMHDNEFYKVMWQDLSLGKTWRGDVINRRKDGSFYIEDTTITPFKDANGKTTNYFAVKQDITKRHQAERMVIESEAKLQQLNASKDKFFSIIGHDLRAPFTGILGLSEYLAQEAVSLDIKTISELAGQLAKASKSVYELLENLLQWSLVQTGSLLPQKEYFEIGKIITAEINLLRARLVDKKITINNTVPLGVFVLADPNMIATVVRNLLSNALKFSYPESTIDIYHTSNQEDNTITVRDYGVGIPPHISEKLFTIDRAATGVGTKKEKGTGLGLILVKEFVESNAGKINVESQVGVGTKMSFSLPRSHEN